MSGRLVPAPRGPRPAHLACLCGLAAAVGCAALPWQRRAPVVAQERVEDLVEHFWRLTLSTRPHLAVRAGDPAFLAELPEASLEARRATQATYQELRQRLLAINTGHLAPRQMEISAHLLAAVDEVVEAEICQLHLWQVDPFDGPQTLPWAMLQAQVVDSPAAAARYLMRLEGLEGWLEQMGEGLAIGRAARLSAPPALIEATDAALAAWLAQPPDLLPPPPLVAQPRLWADLRADLGSRGRPAVAGAWRHYRAIVETLADGARGDGAVTTAVQYPACYRALLRHHSGGREDFVALMELAQAELGRLQATLVGPGPPAAAPPAAPTAAPADLSFGVASARARLVASFGALPAVEVMRAAGDGPLPRRGYVPADVVGSRPARLWVDAGDPRSPAAVAAWAARETLPGRHLQAHAAAGAPLALLAPQAITAEGWAAYAQGWAAETGLWAGGGALTRAVHTAHAQDAALAMVDGGLHVLHWPIASACEFLVANLGLPPAVAHRLVLGALAQPGAAWAPLLGRLAFADLRDEAERRLGPRLDVDALHRVMLAGGAQPMPAVVARVRAWLVTGAGH